MNNITVLTNKQMKSTKNMMISSAFSLVWCLVKYLPAPWFNPLRYFILKIFCKEIHSSYIGENITIWFPWNISIGRNVSINNGCILDGTGGIIIEDSVRIAGNVGILTADHGYCCKEKLIRKQGFLVAPIVIEKDVWIGASANITKGVVIGEGAVVGCGSVITKDVSQYSIVAGNPGKIIKYRE